VADMASSLKAKQAWRKINEEHRPAGVGSGRSAAK
jgi:hypothetical protein